MKEINRELWEAWLFSQPKERSFNYADCCACAVCAFTSETTNCKGVIVAGELVWANLSDYPQKPLTKIPEWLWKVIHVFSGNYELTVPAMQARYLELFPETNLASTPPRMEYFPRGIVTVK